MINRYEDADIRRVWSRSNQVALWASVELAWMRQWDQAAAHDAETAGRPTAARVAQLEAGTRHEFTAFLRAWTERLPADSEARRWLHYGLTSSDVIDTAQCLQLWESNAYIRDSANHLVNLVESVARELDSAGIEQVGRTHGQWAQPRPAANPLRVFAGMIRRQQSRLVDAAAYLRLADFSGPTGGRQDLPDFKVIRALSELNLDRALSSTQILPRDSMVHWAHTVANTVTVCEAIADHYWFLCQSEVAEVAPGLPAPSSAMPHKRNPASAEQIRGLARVARGLVGALDESIVQRGDRDLGHSSAERLALPDLCHLARTALIRTAGIVQNYHYQPDAIHANLQQATNNGARSAERVNRYVRVGNTREEAMMKGTPA